MKTLLPKALLLLAVFTIGLNAQAQVRYLEEIYSNVTVDDGIVYGQNYTYADINNLSNLVMDVYRPAGDTPGVIRPVVLLAHNGLFLPESLTNGAMGLCFAGRKDSGLVEICKRFARRGYVAISFDYRTGWNITSSNSETRTSTWIQAAYRAMQDAKTLVRYLKKDVATNSNQWGVDTTRIIIGGSHSGGILAMMAGALNQASELKQAQLTVGGNGVTPFVSQSTTGDFNGIGGTQNYSNHTGYTSTFQGVLSLGGSLPDTSWIQSGEVPVFAFQGVSETSSPYNMGMITTSTGQPIVTLSGSGDCMPRVRRLGNNNSMLPNSLPAGPPNKFGGSITTPIEGLYPFYGQQTEPWDWYSCAMTYYNSTAGKSKAMLYIDTIFGYLAPRLYKTLINSSYTGAVTPPSVALGSNQTVCSGTAITLPANATSGTSPYTYAWQATGSQLSCNNCASPTVTVTQNSIYSVTVTDAASQTVSGTVNINATPLTIPTVTIGVNPAGAVCQGANLTFTATATNAGALPVYQWKVNGVNAGTNSNTYSSTALTNNSNVTCVVTADASCPGKDTSNSIITTINATVPSVTITANPSGLICPATNVTFTAAAVNGGTPVYQWKLNGNNVGTNSSTYSNAALANGNTVRCDVTSNATCATPATVSSNTITAAVSASCSGGTPMPYLDEVYSNVIVNQGVIYGQNYTYDDMGNVSNLVMDVYRPAGDTSTRRPVVLLTHNGFLLPSAFINGIYSWCFEDRQDSGLVEICTRFAQRGYVAISFDYRTGWAATSSDQAIRSKTWLQAAYRGQQDAKTLVRYLRKDFATNGNQWGIDTGRIVIGGSNSGGIIAMMAGSFNQVSELSVPQFVDTGGTFIKQSIIGDFDGIGGTQNFSNHTGYSSAFHGVLSLGGAVPDTSWIQAGEVPVFAFQGVNETLVPYNTGLVTTGTGQPIVTLSGSGDFMPRVLRVGNNNGMFPNNMQVGPPNKQNGVQTVPIEGLYPFYGEKTEPWDWYRCSMATPFPYNATANKTKANLYIDTIFGYMGPRLYKLLVDPLYVGTPVVPALTVSAGTAQSVCSGTSVNIGATVTGGTSPFTYAWQSTGSALLCNNCVSSSATVTQNSTYTVTVTDAASQTATATVAVTTTASVVPTISVSVNPTGTVCAGTNLTFTASGNNTGNAPAYQWTVNNVNAGTGTTYSSSTLANGDIVKCRLTSNAACAVPSVVFDSILANISSVTPQIIIIPDQTGAICTGSAITFTAHTQNPGTSPSYQWKVGGLNTGPDSDVFTTSSLTNGATVSCVLTSNAACATTNTATSNNLIVAITGSVTPSVALTVSKNPMCPFDTVTFTAFPSGGGSSPTYQWFINNQPIPIITFDSLRVSGLTQGISVKTILTSSAGCATTSTATSNTITVTITPAVLPTIVISTATTNICQGASVTFNAAYTHSGFGFGLQWKKNGNNVGAGAISYTDNALAQGDVITCQLTSTEACASPAVITSNSITMAVAATVTPTISISTTATSICSGTNVIFTATATNAGTPSYQWKKNGNDVGTNAATYSDNALATGDAITCSLTSTATCTTQSTAVSNTLNITVAPSPSAIITPQGSTTVCDGDSVMLSAPAGNTAYLWNTGKITRDVFVKFAGSYSVTVTNINNCTAVSTPVVITVGNSVIPTISISTPAQQVCSGANVVFTATVTNAGTTPVYQWKKGGNNVGTNQNTYTDNGLSTGQQITCVLTSNAACAQPVSVTSSALSVMVNSSPGTVTITSDKQTICDGDSAHVSAPAGYVTYAWSNNKTTSGFYTKFTGSYYVTVTDVNGCTASSNQVSITVNSQPAQPVITRTLDTLSSTVATTYQWILDGNPVNNATQQKYGVTQNGNYQVQITDANGCSNISSVSNVTNVGVSEVSSDMAVNVYPNPNNGTFVLQFADDALRLIQVTDVTGKLIAEAKAAAITQQITLPETAQGIYFVRITQGGLAKTLRVSVVR